MSETAQIASDSARRVLCWCTSSAEYRLTRARAPDVSADLSEYQDWFRPLLRYGVRGDDHEIDMRCPSLRAIMERSESWGTFLGCNNRLYLISDNDWATLLRETAEIEVKRRAAEEQELAEAVAAAEYNRTNAGKAEAWDRAINEGGYGYNPYRR